jgi:hypothetical protein
VHQSLTDPQNAFERGLPINRSGPRGFKSSVRTATRDTQGIRLPPSRRRRLGVLYSLVAERLVVLASAGILSEKCATVIAEFGHTNNVTEALNCRRLRLGGKRTGQRSGEVALLIALGKAQRPALRPRGAETTISEYTDPAD